MGGATLLGTGLIVGVACHFAAAALVPKAPKDLIYLIMLIERLIAIYAAVVGLWLGWLQKSWWRPALGVGIGIAAWLCCEATRVSSPGSWLPLMIFLPPMLGATLAALVGSGRHAGLRLVRGLVAGAVFAFVYGGILLVAGMDMLVPAIADAPIPVFEAKFAVYVHEIGPLAMAVASMLFFPLIRRAALPDSMKLFGEKTPAPIHG